MRKCTVASVLVGAVILLGGTARGNLVGLGSPETSTTFVITTTNNTYFTWTGYVLTLDPTKLAAFVQANAGSTKFKTVEYVDPWTIRFKAPEEVPHGGVVTIQFDVTSPESGPYELSLTQSPIPEPATAAFLGLGTLAVLAARRKK